ncbi:DUF1634 domain-containing protein [Pedobacter yulinensis]|uniref:DUF1634 domain-containing protein n=1 Tax=Pedobacter yulinensis TaxID=2126353 RepID=A0A2T3HPR2_9SPHI|nr:DUF1634 domain-containing protein [Pedobacter yulinensis]PST84434.1 DUF1634 domain-containing protein [Pedobacter yulinensis]
MKKEPRHYIGDKDIQVIIGTLLRVGVYTSLAIVLLGGVIFMAGHAGKAVDYASFRPQPAGLASIGGILKGLFSLDGMAVIQFGILLLIFTPIARVVFSIFGFLIERDYLYVGIGLVILAIIALSMNGGFTH